MMFRRNKNIFGHSYHCKTEKEPIMNSERFFTCWKLNPLLIALVASAYSQIASAADFSVTTPNGQFSYVINGANGNPGITLVRGRTYTFAINTSFDHPFAIGTSIGASAPPGVTGNGVSSGTVTFKVPTNAQDCVYYCTVHDF